MNAHANTHTTKMAPSRKGARKPLADPSVSYKEPASDGPNIHPNPYARAPHGKEFPSATSA
eukprot:2825285-Pyramimonas_sp.AAC.1